VKPPEFPTGFLVSRLGCSQHLH